MQKRVIKRDGKFQDFNFAKIEDVVSKAFKSCNLEVPDKFITQLKEEVDKFISDKENIDIEDIQDIIQKFLIKKNKYDVVESFILCREKRRIAREQKSKLVKGMREKLEAKNVQNQNANVDEMSFGGRIGEASRVATKQIALDYYMSNMARENHLNNEIYVHDLDSYVSGMHNCLSIPFDQLLANGFNTRQTDVRPANSINTAFQLVAVIFQLQSLQQFGGVSATHLDWTMVPYVRKSFYKHYKDAVEYVDNSVDIKCYNSELSIDDELYKKHDNLYKYALDMTLKECHQAVEGLFHNLNTLQSRSGNQLPFTSINFGTCTLPEGRMVIKELLNVSIEGIGKLHKTPIFPCSIFQSMEGVNRKEGDLNYDLFKLALKSTSQRLYPNYCNVEWSGAAGYDKNDPKTYFSTMGCRTANGADINALPGQNPQLKDGRGNICPVTIILPTIAMEAISKLPEDAAADERFNAFMSVLKKKIAEAKDMLIERFNWICKQPMESARFMYENNCMYGFDGKNISSALKHGTLALGQLGLAETLNILVDVDHTTEEGMKYAKEIEKTFKELCAEYKQKYKLNFGVYYTPAENLCYTAFKKWKSKYGEKENVTYYIDKEGNKHEKLYFTNSMHVPVYDEMNPFEKIDIESQLTGYSSAGCITYVELPSTTKHNIEALETLVLYAMDKDIPYFAVNVPNDTCLDCGYTDEIGESCPQCGSPNIQRLRRVTGYLTGNYTTAFNLGKQCETAQRVKHVKH